MGAKKETNLGYFFMIPHGRFEIAARTAAALLTKELEGNIASGNAGDQMRYDLPPKLDRSVYTRPARSLLVAHWILK